jgi:hypothetical protein
MSRPCSVCHSVHLAAISADIANGVTDQEIARRYSLSKSGLSRHRQHLGAPNSVGVIATKGAAFTALASLPTREEGGSALSAIAGRIDSIVTTAEQEKSLAVAIVGLRELRATVDSQMRLAGHIGSGSQVQVNTQVNVDVGSAVSEIIAALRPKVSKSIPKALRTHIEDAPLNAAAIARLEAVVDGE